VTERLCDTAAVRDGVLHDAPGLTCKLLLQYSQPQPQQAPLGLKSVRFRERLSMFDANHI